MWAKFHSILKLLLKTLNMDKDEWKTCCKSTQQLWKEENPTYPMLTPTASESEEPEVWGRFSSLASHPYSQINMHTKRKLQASQTPLGRMKRTNWKIGLEQESSMSLDFR